MFRDVKLAAALVSFLCISYLLISPHNRIEFFLTRRLGRMLFPRLDPFRQQQRTAILAGVLLATILAAAVIVFILNHFNRR